MTPEENCGQNGEMTMSTRNNYHSDLTVSDVMLPLEGTPKTSARTLLKEALEIMDKHRLGIVCISDSDGALQGIITDGDIRRGIEKGGIEVLNKTASFIMSKNPKSIAANTLAISALELMEKYSITGLFVYSDKNLQKPDGIIHIHDIIKSGIQ